MNNQLTMREKLAASAEAIAWIKSQTEDLKEGALTFEELANEWHIPDLNRIAVERVFETYVRPNRMTIAAFAKDIWYWQQFGWPTLAYVRETAEFDFWVSCWNIKCMPHSEVQILSLANGLSFYFDNLFWSVFPGEAVEITSRSTQMVSKEIFFSFKLVNDDRMLELVKKVISMYCKRNAERSVA